MKFVSLNTENKVGNVIENIVNQTSKLDQFVYTTAEGEYGVLSGFQVGYCVGEDNLDPVTVTPQVVADYLKPYKIEELQEQCNLIVASGFEYMNGDKFLYGADQQNDFSQKQILLLLNPALTTVQVQTKNNGIKKYTRQEFINLVTYANEFKDQLMQRLDDLIQKINETEYSDVQELRNLTFVEDVSILMPDAE
ncbi:hypothetical protein [Priestia aryabhattai]|uniref:hypothetical protein n=1 Tax=Priestia aryabhattai TaxID=412384 RepID=UPI00064F2DF4|nr:hypothetical protein [Priestia aryabhattai]KML27771.1 hypothetical protein VL11_17530 [Priestia aryabhattai]KMO01926.1 hypothetical protein ABV89_00145 [Priestia aryabhattai]